MKPRTLKELELMRAGGKMTAAALKNALAQVIPGVSCLELEKVAEETILKLGGEISFRTVRDYRWTTCITINEQVVHGIPTQRKLQIGDVVSIDLGVLYKGWHTDAAWSLVVGEDREKEKFLSAGEEALWLGIKQAIDGNRIGDISTAIQEKIEGAGFSVVRSLVGHGVGRSLHEEPEVPGYGKKGTGMILKSGETLAIEVIYTKGGPEVVLEADGWTISSADGSLSGLFEMSVIVGKEKAEVLTDWRKV